MPLENDIQLFRQWATKLGCPPDFLPGEEALKSIFKSRQRELFCNLIKRVQPRQDVEAIRDNILLHKMEKLKDQVVPACSRSFLPREMQIYLKVKDLNTRKDQIASRIEEYKREYEGFANAIKTKNIQTISLEHKQETLQAKIELLEFKCESLEKSVKKEEQHKEHIIVNMPVKLSAKNANEQEAMNAVEKALNELNYFYNFCIKTTNSQNLQEAKDELWKKMRSIFANHSNFLIFNSILHHKEDQLQCIMTLNKTNMEESVARTLTNNNHSSAATAREPLNAFELKLMKTKGDLLGIVAKYLTARNERISLDNVFSNSYGPFVDELQKKVNLFNAGADDGIDDIISDYIVQYNLRNFLKSKNEFLSQQIDFYKTEIENGKKQLQNHEVLLGSIKQVYGDINASINRIQCEMLQLNQIKEKIMYSKNMMKHMLDDMQTSIGAGKTSFLPTKLQLNNNTFCGDSFESVAGYGNGGADLVFSSTKLDFDCTNNSLNNTTLRRSFGASNALSPTQLTRTVAASVAATGANDGRFILPSHLIELNTFAEMPLEKFNCLFNECAFYLSPNPLVIESRELSSTIQLAPGNLLTPYGALQEVRNRIIWADLITKHSNDLKLDLDLIMVDWQAFKQKIKTQRDQIEELLDKIDITSINTNRVLQKTSKIYDFFLENPLRHYIPPTKVFSNQTYAEYEAEFSMYYRMATVGNAIKS